MAEVKRVPCWRIDVWRGHWQLRSIHDTEAEARLQFLVQRRQHRFDRFRIVASTRRVATYTEAPAPTQARRFREAQADRMVVRRQAFSYYKSGSNGTEVPQPPKEAS